MNEIKHSKAMAVLDDDYDLFNKIADSYDVDNTNLSTSYSKQDYADFYNILKSKNDFTDEQLDHIADTGNNFVAMLTFAWAYVSKENNRDIDKNEFLEKYLTEMI